MKEYIEKRVIRLAEYVLETKATVRHTAKKFGISKSTVHKDICERLPMINKGIYKKIRGILDENKSQRHIRGGIATREKYLKLKAD